MEIKKICENKNNGQKFICVPTRSSLKAGDYVALIKISINEQQLNDTILQANVTKE